MKKGQHYPTMEFQLCILPILGITCSACQTASLITVTALLEYLNFADRWATGLFGREQVHLDSPLNMLLFYITN